MSKILLFCKDFSNQGSDKYFIWYEGQLIEKSASQICDEEHQIICHDYWLIASSIAKIEGRLPKDIVDIHEFSIAICGEKKTRKLRDRAEIRDFLKGELELKNDRPNDVDDKQLAANQSREVNATIVSAYLDIFYKRKPFNAETYKEAAKLIEARWKLLQMLAESNGEQKRQIEIEIPVFNLLHKHITPGICINQNILREHKKDIEYRYYKELKGFSQKYDLPLEDPSDRTIVDYLEAHDLDFSEISVDYMLEFVPTPDGFAEAVKNLRKLSASRALLAALPLSKQRAAPIIETFGSVTSRIYFKDPVFQNISKRHRNIISAESGKKLSYVDYDQFEVGVMAALSGDSCLRSLYLENDLYAVLSEQLFGDQSQRKFAKRLFLSYAYGMKLKKIADAAQAKGADRGKVNAFFRQLTIFELWKEKLQNQFLQHGSISTSEGNSLRRSSQGPLSEKEKRSCISQVVQGTASLIFKKALIAVDKAKNFRILVPMHDAVLVEHSIECDPQILVRLFSEAMTAHFNGAITGKASLEDFVTPDIALSAQGVVQV